MKKVLSLIVPVLVSAALLYWVLSDLKHPEKVWTTIKQASFFYLVIAYPFELGSHYVRAMRWRRFIGIEVPAYYAFSSVMIGYAVNGLLPRGGEFARIINMNRMTGVKIAHLLATLLVERLLDLLTLLALIGITILLIGDVLAESFPLLATAAPAGLAAVVIGFASVLLFALVPQKIARLLGSIGRRLGPKGGQKMEALVNQVNLGFSVLRSPAQLFAVLLETIATWVLHWLSFVCVLISFGFLQPIGLEGSVVVLSITTASAVVPSAGAIGAFHKLGVDSFVLLYGMDFARALGFVSVLHLLAYYVVPLGSGFILWLGQGLLVTKKGK